MVTNTWEGEMLGFATGQYCCQVIQMNGLPKDPTKFNGKFL